MWVKVKETGQELFMNDTVTRFGPGALALVARGEAEEIEQPTAERLAAGTYPDRTMVMLPVEVRKIVQDLGLANQPQSYAFIQRYLNLEAEVASLRRGLNDLNEHVKTEVAGFLAKIEVARDQGIFTGKKRLPA